MRLGGRDGRNQTLTAPTLKIGVKSSDTRTWTRFNFLLRQEVTNATNTKTAPTANQPLHNNRMKKSSFMCVLLPSNDAGQWRRVERVRYGTETQSRRPLDSPCWRERFSWAFWPDLNFDYGITNIAQPCVHPIREPTAVGNGPAVAQFATVITEAKVLACYPNVLLPAMSSMRLSADYLNLALHDSTVSASHGVSQVISAMKILEEPESADTNPHDRYEQKVTVGLLTFSRFTLRHPPPNQRDHGRDKQADKQKGYVQKQNAVTQIRDLKNCSVSIGHAFSLQPIQITGAAPRIFNSRHERNRRVQCICVVGLANHASTCRPELEGFIGTFIRELSEPPYAAAAFGILLDLSPDHAILELPRVHFRAKNPSSPDRDGRDRDITGVMLTVACKPARYQVLAASSTCSRSGPLVTRTRFDSELHADLPPVANSLPAGLRIALLEVFHQHQFAVCWTGA